MEIAQIALVVRDYDEAIAWYTGKLGFVVLEDTRLSDTKRWVRVAPSKASAFCLLLARAANEEQSSRVGNQAGGRVFLFLHTDDFTRDHSAFVTRGVQFVEKPRREAYGRVCVFEDLYGNRWDLVEQRPSPEGDSA